jgi:hypothetical protein
MSAMPDSEFPVFTLDDLDIPINLVEGNLQLYLHRITCEETARAAIPNCGTLTVYQRTCAMNYLGKHGQIHGVVCSKGPFILSDCLKISQQRRSPGQFGKEPRCRHVDGREQA